MRTLRFTLTSAAALALVLRALPCATAHAQPAFQAGELSAAASGDAVAAATALNLAGYQVATTASTASTDATVTVPKLGTCPPTASFQAIVAGSAVTGSAGTSGGGIALICADGAPSYLAQTQVNGQGTLEPELIDPGDHVRVQVSVTATTTSVTLDDLTKGWTLTAGGGGSAPAVAAIGVIAGNCLSGACSPVPAFTGSAFLGAINGRFLPRSARTDLLAADGSAEASGTNALFGLLFGVNYRASCVPDPATNRC